MALHNKAKRCDTEGVKSLCVFACSANMNENADEADICELVYVADESEILGFTQVYSRTQWRSIKPYTNH